MNRIFAALALLALSACAGSGSRGSGGGTPSAASRYVRPAHAEAPARRDARVQAGSEEAARLIREAVPLVDEVGRAIEDPAPRDRARREELRVKAAEAEAKLNDAAAIYRAIELDSKEQGEIPQRLRSIADIVAVLRGSVRRL